MLRNWRTITTTAYTHYFGQVNKYSNRRRRRRLWLGYCVVDKNDFCYLLSHRWCVCVRIRPFGRRFVAIYFVADRLLSLILLLFRRIFLPFQFDHHQFTRGAQCTGTHTPVVVNRTQMSEFIDLVKGKQNRIENSCCIYDCVACECVCSCVHLLFYLYLHLMINECRPHLLPRPLKRCRAANSKTKREKKMILITFVHRWTLFAISLMFVEVKIHDSNSSTATHRREKIYLKEQASRSSRQWHRDVLICLAISIRWLHLVFVCS